MTRPVTTTSAPLPQAVDDAPRAEVSVGRQWATEPQLRGSRQQVVALHMSHAHRHPEPLGQCPHRGGQAGRVESACVGDDAHADVVRQAEAVLELGQKCLRIAPLGRLRPVAGQDQHRQLGQIVAGQIVQLAPVSISRIALSRSP